MELLVRTRKGSSRPRKRSRNRSAPGIARSSCTSTPSMSISHERISRRVTPTAYGPRGPDRSAAHEGTAVGGGGGRGGGAGRRGGGDRHRAGRRRAARGAGRRARPLPGAGPAPRDGGRRGDRDRRQPRPHADGRDRGRPPVAAV